MRDSLGLINSYSPTLLAADNVYRFGLSELSSDMSLKSTEDDISFIVVTLEITSCSSVE